MVNFSFKLGSLTYWKQAFRLFAKNELFVKVYSNEEKQVWDLTTVVPLDKNLQTDYN